MLFQVPKLIEGREYIIRIMAQNIYGISDPLLSAETKARDIFSKSPPRPELRTGPAPFGISSLQPLLLFVITEVPDAPKQPVIKEVYHDSALVSWEPPADGGKPITGYIVERKETMANRWDSQILSADLDSKLKKGNI